MLLQVDARKPDPEVLRPAAEALRDGAVVAFPTETVYGLGAVWDNDDAVREIFRVKGRPLDNPLIIHVASIKQMKTFYAEWDDVAEILIKTFCPGPFTLIMKRAEHVSSSVTAGLATVGVRLPDHPVTKTLIELTGKGIAAPSANLSGRPSPTTAEDAIEDLSGKVPWIIDAGNSVFGVESTIVSWVDGKLELLRPGGISAEEIRNVLTEHQIAIQLDDSSLDLETLETVPRAPGMKYRHYAPEAKVHILSGETNEAKLKRLSTLAGSGALGQRPAFYLSRALAKEAEWILQAQLENHYQLISFADDLHHQDAAAGLFRAFRAFDRLSVSDIWAEEQSLQHLGLAYMNRLRKASRENEGRT